MEAEVSALVLVAEGGCFLRVQANILMEVALEEEGVAFVDLEAEVSMVFG